MANRLIKIKWSIKGYHVFRIVPHRDISLKLVLEENNAYDPSAIAVYMPEMNQIPEHLLDIITHEANQRFPAPQSARSTASLQVGRVPANLCQALRQLSENGYAELDGMMCQALGEPEISRHQPRHYHHYHHGHDREGGGAELPCYYFIELAGSHFRDAMRIFEECLPRDDLDRFFC